jgi:hypothetical protein
MGREIVYCEGCGTNLREPDFEKGGARLLENKPYCAPCRPAEPPPPPPHRSETTRTRKASTPRIPLPPPASPKVSVLAGLGLLAIALLAVVLACGRPTPEKIAVSTPKENREPATAVLPDPERDRAAHEGRLREIDEVIKADPLFERSAEVFRRIDAGRRSAGPHVADFDRIRAAYEKSFEDAAKRLAEFARTEAARLASQAKLDDAVRKCDEYLESYGPTAAAASIRRLREELDRRRAR